MNASRPFLLLSRCHLNSEAEQQWWPPTEGREANVRCASVRRQGARFVAPLPSFLCLFCEAQNAPRCENKANASMKCHIVSLASEGEHKNPRCCHLSPAYPVFNQVTVYINKWWNWNESYENGREAPVSLPAPCPCLPLELSKLKKHMAPARADCCPSATLPRRDWLKLGHSLPLPASDWLKLGHSLRPQVSPCHCRVTAWPWGLIVRISVLCLRDSEKHLIRFKIRFKTFTIKGHHYKSSPKPKKKTKTINKENMFLKRVQIQILHLSLDHTISFLQCNQHII